jgi:hypothetical protein
MRLGWSAPLAIVVAAMTAACGGGGKPSTGATAGGARGATSPPPLRSSAIDMTGAESAARTAVAQQTGAGVRSVSCPREAALKVGADFTCEALGADGTKAPVVLVMTDTQGDVALRPLALLQTQSAAKLIATALTHEYRSTVDVRCPDLVRAAKNTTMTCHATHAGVTHAVLVTVKDNQGSLAYKLE